MREFLFRDRLTRQQLSTFLKTPELIRAFENLSEDVAVVTPENQDEISRIAQLALALAAQAMMLVESMQPEDPQVIPGPAGVDGAAGLALAFLNDFEADNEMIPRNDPAPIEVGGSRATDAWRIALIAALVSRGIITDTSVA